MLTRLQRLPLHIINMNDILRIQLYILSYIKYTYNYTCIKIICKYNNIPLTNDSLKVINALICSKAFSFAFISFFTLFSASTLVSFPFCNLIGKFKAFIESLSKEYVNVLHNMIHLVASRLDK